jgi:hypothetical protein
MGIGFHSTYHRVASLHRQTGLVALVCIANLFKIYLINKLAQANAKV